MRSHGFPSIHIQQLKPLLLSVSLHLGLGAAILATGLWDPSSNFHDTEVEWIELSPKLLAPSGAARPNESKRVSSAPKTILSDDVLQKSKATTPAETREAANRGNSAGTPLSSSSQSEAGQALGAAGASGEASAIELSVRAKYLQMVRSEIQKKLVYPPQAKRLGHTGTVLVRFRVAQSGKIESSEILESSPFETLNRAARDLIASVGPLAPLPKDLRLEHWSFEIPLEYEL